MKGQLCKRCEMVGQSPKQIGRTMQQITSNSKGVIELIGRSFLTERMQRNYEQVGLTRLKRKENLMQSINYKLMEKKHATS